MPDLQIKIKCFRFHIPKVHTQLSCSILSIAALYKSEMALFKKNSQAGRLNYLIVYRKSIFNYPEQLLICSSGILQRPRRYVCPFGS